MSEVKKPLSNKQRVFVEEYLKCWNSSEAARRAGYTGQPNVIGPRLLANVSISEAIQSRLAELKMSADEVLTRLAEHARGDMGEFLKFYEGVKDPFVDLQAAKEKGLLRLVKKLKYNQNGHPEIELYDAQSALIQLGKAAGVFSEPGSSVDTPIYHKWVVMPPKEE